MGKKLLDWDENNTDIEFVALDSEKHSDAIKDIAIIGMAGRLGNTNDINDFWEAIVNQKDCIVSFPDSRKKDIEEYIKNKTGTKNAEFKEASYLDEIDKFDYNLFSISPKEAALMDPAQRMFLEIAWSAIEDAGYGGKRLSGTKTGVYVGYSSTPSEEYIKYIEETDSSLLDMAIPGNLKSIISSRISYLLDLKGPSMLIDTACSSSLVALHIACQGLRNNDCQYAIVGGVKVNIVPGLKEGNDGMGICSDTGRTMTFDESSNGTGLGEGIAAVLLKPLKNAVKDRDSIYAVIKGTAINQDGTSIGITAPNSAAQEEVILSAWKDAQIDPNSISYIEAHGTATNLGDPIEISGIERAFQHYGDKRQFCAIGSVKTNVGHLDSTAGLAGLIKTTLALKNKKIPPNIHFETPNRKINFIESPVYVSDTLKEWDLNGEIRRAGVSSFGISGTNAHVVLEEVPILEQDKPHKISNNVNILTLSAKSRFGVKKLIENYLELIDKDNNIDMKNICFTANTGRGQYSNRLAIIFYNLEDLKEKLKKAQANLKQNNESNIFYNEFRVITSMKREKLAGEVTEEEKWILTNKADKKIPCLKSKKNKEFTDALRDLADLYVHGADVNWDSLYDNDNSYRRISIPGYPFERKRCWLTRQVKDSRIHPLIDRCIVKSLDIDIYETTINTERQWEIGEHSLDEDYLLLGTAYVEIAAEIAKRYLGTENYELKNVVFASPLFAKQGEDKVVHIIVKKESSFISFSIASKSEENNEWTTHSEGKIYRIENQRPNKVDINQIISRCSYKVPIKPEVYLLGFVKISDRWKCTKVIYFGEDEAIAYIELDKKFKEEIKNYNIYPSLLDAAANAANGAVVDGPFLPLNYSSIKLFNKVPDSFYSNIRYKKKEKEDQMIASFDITLIDKEGNVFAEIKDYTIKKVNINEIMPNAKENLYYKTVWCEQQSNNVEKINEGNILVIRDDKALSSEIISKLRESKKIKVYDVLLGNEFIRNSECSFTISSLRDDCELLIEELKSKEITQIIYTLSILGTSNDISSLASNNVSYYKCIDGFFYFIKSTLNQKLSNRLYLTIISDYSFEVDKREPIINPYGASLHGMIKALANEYPNHILKAIDIDENTKVDCIINELNNKSKHTVAYRNGKRYAERMEEIKLEKLIDDPIELKEKGVYIITGGAGGIGLEIAKYLGAKNNINFAMLNRTLPPSRDNWDDILKIGLDKKSIDRIEKIREIEAMGSSVECISGDISNIEQMRPIFNELRERYGSIRGIIHNAGVAGDGFIIRKEKSVFDEVVTPKVKGTWILDKLTEADELDFFIVSSSLTAIFGSAGQTDYTLANAFLDAFAVYRNKKGKRTLSINWPGWSETGMAVDYGIGDKKSIFKAMPTAKIIQAFDRFFDKKISRIAICEFDYNYLADSIDSLIVELPEKIRNLAERKRVRQDIISSEKNSEFNISISGKSLVDITETEKQLAIAWSKILGLNEIDLYDKFFEIGGDSLLATHMLKEIDKIFPNKMDVTDIFIYSTICEMAEFIDKKINKKNESKTEAVEINDEELDSILSKLASGDMSTDEVERLLLS